MSVLGAHNKDRRSTRDKANIGNSKVNKGCPPLTANCTSADNVENWLGPSVEYIRLGVYHTGSFNAIICFATWYAHLYSEFLDRIDFFLSLGNF